jgi:hypothetical protein
MDETLNLRKQEISLYNKNRRDKAKDYNETLKEKSFVYKDNFELVTGWAYTEETSTRKIRDKYLHKFEYYRGELDRVRGGNN